MSARRGDTSSSKVGLRLGLGAVVVALAMTVFGGVAQGAPGARWTISSLAVPTHFAPGDGEDMYSVSAVTVGNAPTFSGQVTVTDELPVGVTPVEAKAAIGLGQGAQITFGAESPCVIVGQVVSCTVDEAELEAGGGQLFPSAVVTFSLGVTVSVSPEASGSLTNVARVEGGGYSPASTTQTNLVSTAPVPPGLAYSQTEVVSEDGTPALQAGSHPYELVSSMRFNAGGVVDLGEATPEATPAGSPKDVEVALPPGIVGNPLSGPRCSQRTFQTENSQFSCPVATQVGIVALRFFKETANELPVRYPIYNIEPSAGQPAELGFSVSPVIHVPMLFSVRSNGDYGLTTQLRNISSGDPIEAAVVSIWGVPGAAGHDQQRVGTLGASGECLRAECPSPPEASFLTMPSACSPGLAAGIATDFWQAPGAILPGGGPDLLDPNWTSFESPLLDGVTGCGALSLSSAAGSPELDVHPNGTGAAGAPAGYDVDLRVPQEEDPHANATPTLKGVSVTMPRGTFVSASSAQGLGACSEAEIELHSSEPLKPGTCPSASKLGTAEIFSPLLAKPLTGSIFLAQQGNAGPAQGRNPFGSLLALYLEAAGSGVLVKLAGQVHLDQSTGQVTASFEDNPQLPFDEIKIHLLDGPRAALANPSACGPAAASAALTPHSTSTATAVSGAPFVVTGCGPARFKPSFSAGDTGTQRAGAYGPIAVSFGRGDAEQNLSGVSVKLPEGLLAKIAGVTECGEAQANAGTCPVASQIGTTTVSAGPGSSPITLPQPGQSADPVYLTGPYKGAALGLSVVTPAVAGPFDLGTVVVRAALAVDPVTAQVIATSDPLPTMLQGIPLDIRSVTLNLNRRDFAVNPTDCRTQSIDATLTSTAGLAAAASSPFQAVDCAALRFEPKLQVSLNGPTRRSGFPALKAVVTYPKKGTYANIASAQVNLPHSEFLEQAHIGTVCTRVQFAAGGGHGERCPKASIYGRARATTPLLDHPLEGPVYLRSSNHKLPDLVAALNGQIDVALAGKVDSGPNQGIRNTFELVPDAPVSRFVLEMKGGKKGLLVNSENLCAPGAETTGLARFTGQNGRVLNLKPKVANDCDGGKKNTKGKRGR
jgi:hypothetical protein